MYSKLNGCIKQCTLKTIHAIFRPFSNHTNVEVIKAYKKMCPKIQIATVYFLLIASLVATVASTTITTSSAIQYEADYELPMKIENGTERQYYAYIVEEGDLLIRKICTCVPKKKCFGRDSVKLAE